MKQRSFVGEFAQVVDESRITPVSEEWDGLVWSDRLVSSFKMCLHISYQMSDALKICESWEEVLVLTWLI